MAKAWLQPTTVGLVSLYLIVVHSKLIHRLSFGPFLYAKCFLQYFPRQIINDGTVE